MNGVGRFITIGYALLFAASLAVPVAAQQSGTATVTQDVVEGELTYGLSSGTMEAITFDIHRSDPSITNGSVLLNVEDSRGTFDGWTIEIESTAFIYSGPAPGEHDIAASQAAVIPQIPVVLEGLGLDGIGVPPQAQLDTRRPVLTAVAGAGSGRYQQEIQIQLVIPPQQPAGSYTAQLTVSSSAAPGT